jgi:pimeloyl-ACP methyl ester carboxylesterase
MALPHDVAGAGPAVLLLHNGICDRRMWDRQMKTFAAAHRVIRCDLPGYGAAPVPAGPVSLAEEVLALLDELDVDRAALVGNSLGGRVAVDVCLAAPDRVWALVLIGAGRAGWDWSDTLRRAWAEEEAAVTAGDLDLAVEMSLRLWLDGPRRLPGSVVGPVREQVAAMYRRALDNELAAGGAAGPERRPEGSPASVRAAALVLVGDQDVQDMIDVAEAYTRDLPDARKVVLRGVAHIPSLERPEEFDRLVLGFLGGQDANRPARS